MSVAPLARTADEAGAALALTQPQKVAAVMLALGADAERLLKRLPEADVEQIAREVVELGELSPQQLAGVLDELHTEARAHRFIVMGGEQHARELLRRWRGADADAVVDRLIAAAEPTPFNFLNLVAAADTARILCEEHPQVAAVVVAHLSPALAGHVLAAFPAGVRADVALRVATRQPCPPTLVTRIEDDLRIRLGEQASAMVAPDDNAGMRDLATMLNRVDGAASESILEAIAQVDAGLAQEVRSKMFVFADLAMLDDRDLQEVLRSIDSTKLALAMTGLEGPLEQTIMNNLSQRARDTLAEEFELLGSTRPGEIELARDEIAAQVRALVEDGSITIVRAEDGDVGA